MELHQLRYFCAVAETGSFSRAAEQSHVAQPSLSQQIIKLEEELGARLFDRLGRSVRLTELGKIFLPRARAVLRELEAAKGDVVERKDFVGGPVTVGVIPTVGPYFLPRVLTSFSRKFPQVRFTVVEEITPVLLDRLRAGAIDVAILALPIRGHEFETKPLLTERLFAALPKNHRLAKRTALSLRDLRSEPFLLLRDGHFANGTWSNPDGRALSDFSRHRHGIYRGAHLRSFGVAAAPAANSRLRSRRPHSQSVYSRPARARRSYV